MSKLKFEQKGFKKFLLSNGFYIALAFCLIAVGVATFSTLNKLNEFRDRSENPTKKLGEVVNPVTNIPADTQVRATTAPPTTETTERSTQKSTKEQKEEAGFFVMPVAGNIYNPFSDGELVFSKTFNDYRIHNGIDIEAQKGTKVKAAGDGTVKKIYKDDLWGTVIEIDHGKGIVGYYFGLSDNPPVKEGEAVEVSSVIGSTNEVPCEVADKPHFHFGMTKDGKWVDPVKTMGLSN